MNKQDKRVLETLVRKYDATKKPIFTRPWFNLVLWLMVCFSIFALLQIQVSNIVLIAISAFIGAAVMLSFMIQSSETTWRIIKPFFNVEEAKEKIENT